MSLILFVQAYLYKKREEGVYTDTYKKNHIESDLFKAIHDSLDIDDDKYSSRLQIKIRILLPVKI